MQLLTTIKLFIPKTELFCVLGSTPKNHASGYFAVPTRSAPFAGCQA